MAALGLAEVARLELRYVELPQLLEHVVTLPISVNVVPGDQAAARALVADLARHVTTARTQATAVATPPIPPA